MTVVGVLATALVAPALCYFGLLGLLAVLPRLQTEVFYCHRLPLVERKKLNTPEAFGFEPGQVTPFYIGSPDGMTLHAWHVLPIGVYTRHEEQLQVGSGGLASNIVDTPAFRLLKQDSEARVVVSFHGSTGCLASELRPQCYRNLYSAAPDKIHVLAFDYRGFGRSMGSPSEQGLILDAVSVVEWLLLTACIPSERIVLFGHSLGTAVGLAVLSHYAAQEPTISFAGAVFTACFKDVATLMSTYRIEGLVPVFSPLASAPPLLEFFISFLKISWSNPDRVSEYIRLRERAGGSQKYQLTFIHAEDDKSITCRHSDVMFWHAVRSTTGANVTLEELDEQKEAIKAYSGQGGWGVEWRTDQGVIRQLMLGSGGHEKIVIMPEVAFAILQAFQNPDSGFAVQRDAD